MNFFKKKIATKCCLVKSVEIGQYGWDITYYTTVNDRFIMNSIFDNKKDAEAFFEKVLANKGVTKTKEILRKELI